MKNKNRKLKAGLVALALVAAVAVGGIATTANADPYHGGYDHRGGPPPRRVIVEHRHHHYYRPPVREVYAPPPVVYAPPPQPVSSGINLILPLNFR